MVIDISRVRSYAQARMIENKGERWGQALMNALNVLFPKAEKKISQTEADCFYDNSKEGKFWEALYELASQDEE